MILKHKNQKTISNLMKILEFNKNIPNTAKILYFSIMEKIHN